jgi:hypothetical protein
MASEATMRKKENGTVRGIHQYKHQGLARLRDRTGVSEESWPYVVSAFAGAVGVGIARLLGRRNSP